MKDIALRFLQQFADTPKVAIITGTGLGPIASNCDIKLSIPYNRIPEMPVSTVSSHASILHLGYLGGVAVAVFQGRHHYYEGRTMEQVTAPIRFAEALGVKTIFLSNASGGLSPDVEEGSVVLIKDHISFFTDSPLRGMAGFKYPNRFPDMRGAYSSDLRARAIEAAKSLSIDLKEVVYAGMPGPQLETEAEYNFLKVAGAHCVGMSTVPEVIAARALGLDVMGLSVITDHSDRQSALTLQEIMKKATEKAGVIAAIFEGVIKQMA